MFFSLFMQLVVTVSEASDNPNFMKIKSSNVFLRSADLIAVIVIDGVGRRI